MDPLSVLRDYLIKKNEIIVHKEQVIFGEFSWPKSTLTNYLDYGYGKCKRSKKYYSLECLLHFLKNVELKHSRYIKEAGPGLIQVVHRTDRKDLLAYLNGEIDTSKSCDKFARIENPITVKRIAADNLQNDNAKKPRTEEKEENLAEVTKQLQAARLEEPKELAISADIKSLSEIMTEDKIADIKAKRLVKKRSTVKGSDDIEMKSDVRAILDMDVEETKTIISRERTYKNRNTILQSNKTVFTNIFSVLDGIKIREESKQKPNEAMGPTPSTVTCHSIPSRPKQQLTYNRYDQEKLLKQNKDTGGFKIDTTSTYHGMPLESVKAGINPTILKPHSDAPENIRTATPGLLPVSAAKFTPQQAVKNKRQSQTPIIIVPPCIQSSLITMNNAAVLLEDLKYISNEEKRSQGAKRGTDILIQRRKKHGTVPYRVIDNPLKLTKEEWERVVAVFVLGPQWQFKGWPFNGNPVEIFSKISGFHIKFDEMNLEANVASWAVSVIELSKTKRHLDRAALMQFWDILDKHMVQTKPHLRF